MAFDTGRDVRTVPPRPPLRRRFSKCLTTMAVPGSCLVCALLVARPLHALDPNKRLTQYLHSSWRSQDGSAPASMFTITQASDGFLWFASPPRGIYRFDGVRFLPWLLPPKGSLTDTILNVVGDREGGLWTISESGIAHVKGADVLSDVELGGVQWFDDVTVGADGSLWVARGKNAVSDAPLCQVTDRAVRCFGKSDGLPISPAEALLADGNGGFWIGGQTALVHWRAGVSQVYPIEALESNAGNSGISSLARGPDGTLWVGILAAGPGLGLGQLRDGIFTPFVTPTFDGSKVAVYAMIVDRDGALWVATSGRGIWRIHGTVVDHYGRTEGLSSDTALALFEDREGIVWVATITGHRQLSRSPHHDLLGLRRSGERCRNRGPGGQRWHRVGGKLRITRLHRERTRLVHSRGGWSSGESSDVVARRPRREHVGRSG